MKVVITLALVALILTGCSGEQSAQEKRNKFDSCVISKMEEYSHGNLGDFRSNTEMYRSYAEMNCKQYLE